MHAGETNKIGNESFVFMVKMNFLVKATLNSSRMGNTSCSGRCDDQLTCFAFRVSEDS